MNNLDLYRCLYRLNFSEHRGVDQNTNDSDSSREDGVDVDSVADTATSGDGPWEGWTDEEKDVIKEHISYYLLLINTNKQKLKEMYKCWTTGPVPKSLVKKVPPMPKSDISFIYSEKNSKKKSIKDDNTFLDYLKSKYCSNDEMAEMPTHDLNKIAKHLRKRKDLISWRKVQIRY